MSTVDNNAYSVNNANSVNNGDSEHIVNSAGNANTVNSDNSEGNANNEHTVSKPSVLVMRMVSSSIGSRWFAHVLHGAEPARVSDVITDTRGAGVDGETTMEAIRLLAADGLVDSPDVDLSIITRRGINPRVMTAVLVPDEQLQRETSAAVNGSLLPFTPIGAETDSELREYEQHMRNAINSPTGDPGDPLADVWYPQNREPPRAHE